MPPMKKSSPVPVLPKHSSVKSTSRRGRALRSASVRDRDRAVRRPKGVTAPGLKPQRSDQTTLGIYANVVHERIDGGEWARFGRAMCDLLCNVNCSDGERRR